MPTIRNGVTRDGCVVRVRLSLMPIQVAERRRALRAVPSPIEVHALIDSGAEVTCVDPKVIGRLAPPVKAVIPTHSPALVGLSLSLQYEVDLTILDPGQVAANDLMFAAATVTELDLTAATVPFLIGRDILSHCIFHFNGPAGDFTLTY